MTNIYELNRSVFVTTSKVVKPSRRARMAMAKPLDESIGIEMSYDDCCEVNGGAVVIELGMILYCTGLATTMAWLMNGTAGVVSLYSTIYGLFKSSMAGLKTLISGIPVVGVVLGICAAYLLQDLPGALVDCVLQGKDLSIDIKRGWLGIPYGLSFEAV